MQNQSSDLTKAWYSDADLLRLVRRCLCPLPAREEQHVFDIQTMKRFIRLHDKEIDKMKKRAQKRRHGNRKAKATL